MAWDTRRLARYLTLRDLNVLMTVVRCGSMGKAAAQLALSQPAVSRAVADMEAALGVRLLDRSQRGVEPTIYAGALLEHGVIAFDELQQAVKKIESLTDPTVGEVLIGCTVLLAEGFVPSVISRFSRRYPRVTFQLLADESAASYRALEERKVDLAILRLFEPVAQAHLSTEILYDEPHVVAVGPGSPWTRRRRVQLADLVDDAWVLPPLDTMTGAIVREAFRAVGLGVPSATVVTSSTPARNALVATGRFISILPASLWTRVGWKTRINALPIKLATTRRPIGIVTLKKRALTPAAQLFIDCARDVAQQVLK